MSAHDTSSNSNISSLTETGQNSDSPRRFAVITGASSGIGFELARQFAQNGFDLAIVADGHGIHQAAERLSAMGVHVTPLQIDLAGYDGAENFYQQVKLLARPIDALALNAGVGISGDFVREVELRDAINVINLNITSTVHLTKRFLQDMVSRGEGKVLFTASVVSEMPGPYQSVYAASKAFVYSFSNALRYELKDTGITITNLMPGATDTPFFDRAGMQDTEVGTTGKKENDPADVARQGFEALMAGKDEVIAASLKTKMQGLFDKILPENLKASVHAKMSEPGSAKN